MMLGLRETKTNHSCDYFPTNPRYMTTISYTLTLQVNGQTDGQLTEAILHFALHVHRAQ